MMRNMSEIRHNDQVCEPNNTQIRIEIFANPLITFCFDILKNRNDCDICWRYQASHIKDQRFKMRTKWQNHVFHHDLHWAHISRFLRWKKWRTNWEIIWFPIWGRVSSEDEKRVCSLETHVQREHIFKNSNCPMRKWAKGLREPVNEQAKRV